MIIKAGGRVVQHFFEMIKVLLEKRLIPTVFALVAGALTYAFTPESYWLIVKLGKNAFILVCAGIAFLFFTMIQFIAKKIIDKINDYIENKNYNEKHMNEAVEQLWDYMDKLGEDERKFIIKLVNNGNNALCEPIGRNFNFIDKFYNCRPVIIRRQVERQNEFIEQYKLDEKFYNLLKYSMKKYNKISHFE